MIVILNEVKDLGTEKHGSVLRFFVALLFRMTPPVMSS